MSQGGDGIYFSGGRGMGKIGMVHSGTTNSYFEELGL